jgi:hypothetical protein
MKNVSFLLIVLLSLMSCTGNPGQVNGDSSKTAIQVIDTSDMTNNFYDNTETIPLQVSELRIEGEIANPGPVDFSKLDTHSVIVKETLLDGTGGDKFVGAYRYDGYSLFDILNNSVLKKANSAEFNPIIDLYVEVENSSGEKVVFSWGEIYYPYNLHKVLIASSVSRIVPSKTKDLWPLPESSRIVAGCDLVTERNISNPVKITVKSYPKSFPVVKGLSPMYSPEFAVFTGEGKTEEIITSAIPETITYNTIFYGRGKGIHSTSPFTGIPLKDVISKYYPASKQRFQKGMFCLAAKDGYRCAVSYSELFNRNDQQEFLLIKTEPDEDGGLFRVFAAADFFSDRAIKSLTEIYLIE